MIEIKRSERRKKYWNLKALNGVKKNKQLKPLITQNPVKSIISKKHLMPIRFYMFILKKNIFISIKLYQKMIIRDEFSITLQWGPKGPDPPPPTTPLFLYTSVISIQYQFYTDTVA